MSVRRIQVVGLLALIALLELIAWAGLVPASILPPPHQVFAALAAKVWSGSVFPHAAASFERVGLAFLLAVAVGFPLGVAMWRLPGAVVRGVEPLLASLYAIPWIAFYPLFLVLLGLGTAPMIVIAVILGAIPIALNTYVGFKEIRPIWIKEGRAERCTKWQTLSKILLPAAAPHVVSGMKLGFIYAFLGITGTEFLRSSEGLGFLVSDAYFFFQNVNMYAYVLLIVLTALALSSMLDRVQTAVGRRFE